MSKSYMKFLVDDQSLVSNLLDGEVRGIVYSRKNPEEKEHLKQLGIINPTESIHNFVKKYFKLMVDQKFINQDGTTIFSTILPIAPLASTPEYSDMIKNRMRYVYGVKEEDMPKMNTFIRDLNSIKQTPEMKDIVDHTRNYKRSIERVWKLNEDDSLKHVKSILGYEPKEHGKVNAYIMYPSFNIHRSCQVSEDKTSFYFAKSGETDVNKIVAYLTHQAVHQPLLPYKTEMTGIKRQEFHAFIKFLTDKEIYAKRTGKSYLDIVTQGENGEIMGKLYPYFLGYRYRNADRQGKNIQEEIENAIKRDKAYFDRIPKTSKRRKLFETYNFEKLDPEKIAMLYSEKRVITPYEFVKNDFSNVNSIYKEEYLEKNSSKHSGVR